MKRKRIQSDFERVTGANGRDSYNYTGPLFSLDLSKERRVRYLALCWGVPLLGFLLFVLTGLMNTGGMRAVYIALPFVSLFLPLSLLIGDAYKVTFAKPDMRRAEYERSVMQMKRCTIAGLALSLVTLMGQAVFMIAFGAASSGELWFALGVALLALIFWFFFKAQKDVQIITKR